ncbi:MAG: hypothetical protein IPK53_00440 [bacterium]|nr:hypothetical protein [bacterium]MBK8127432.1 hypothetical protein [bacterium]
MNVFSEEAKQSVLENLLELARSSSSIPAVKLYLDLAAGQSPAEALTVEQALLILRQANDAPEDREIQS